MTLGSFSRRSKVITISILTPIIILLLVIGVTWIIKPTLVGEGFAYITGKSTGSGIDASKVEVDGIDASKVEVDGIDVSHHNGRIQWDEVARNKHIKFAYIKATQGVGYVDPAYKRNIREARKAGLDVGAYHFFTSKKSGAQQFAFFRKTVGKHPGTIVPMVDVELSGIGNMSKSQLRKELKDFCDLVKKTYGKKPIIYVTNGLYNSMIHGAFDDHYIWISRYGFKPNLKGDNKHQIWQFSEHGKVDGISGYTDLNRLSNGMCIDKLKI